MFPKLSILGFYLRIFTKKPYRITAYVLGGIIIANGIAGVISSLCTCQPFAARWNLSIPNAHCIDTVQYWRWISLANIITDVVMLVLPLPVVWTLQVSTTQKYGLTFIFLTGSMYVLLFLLFSSPCILHLRVAVTLDLTICFTFGPHLRTTLGILLMSP